MSGTAWGVLAWLLLRRSHTIGLGWAVAAAPLIGAIVGRVLQPRFESATGAGRALVPLASLYLGATLFGVALAAGHWSHFSGRPVASAAEVIASLWWGITFTGFLLFLWPMAWFTHRTIERLD